MGFHDLLRDSVHVSVFLLAVLYGCKTWYLTKGRKLMESVVEKCTEEKIYRHKIKEITVLL
jgi:hypothetical protein